MKISEVGESPSSEEADSSDIEEVELATHANEDVGAAAGEGGEGATVDSSSAGSASSDEDDGDESDSGSESDNAAAGAVGTTRLDAGAQASAAQEAASRLKTSLRPARSFEPFYGGGAVAISRDEQWLACTCGEEVKVTPAMSRKTPRSRDLPFDENTISMLNLIPRPAKVG
jgi:hypothetical protein